MITSLIFSSAAPLVRLRISPATFMTFWLVTA